MQRWRGRWSRAPSRPYRGRRFLVPPGQSITTFMAEGLSSPKEKYDEILSEQKRKQREHEEGLRESADG